MKQKKYNPTNFLIISVVISILSACGNGITSQASGIPSNNVGQNECISSNFTLAFPVEPETPVGNPRVEILPSRPWQIESQLPVLPNGAHSTSRILLAQTTAGNKGIWVRRQWLVTGQNNNHPTDELWIYRSDTQNWISFPEKINDTNIFIGEIYITRNGSLWSSNYRSKSEEPLFSLYNEKIGQFELDNDSMGIPDGRVVLDRNDVFWIIPHQGFIYSYNTVTRILKKHVTLPQLAVLDVAVAQDGSLYILKGSSYITTTEDETLFHFYPATDKFEEIDVPLGPFPTYWNLLIDHTGNLWLNDRGWMEPNGTWHQIIRSPIFIANNVESGLDYRWKTPSLMLQSSDGKLWFKSDNGMAWLDTQKGQWCWFTTYQSDIVEDQQHNLWMIADSKLYRLALGK